MKNYLPIALLCIIIFSQYSSKAQEKIIDLKVEKVNDTNSAYLFNRFYISGQPNLENLNWYKKRGVTKIINLRSENENENFSNDAFNENKIVGDLNLKYISIPVAGADDYTPAKLNQFISEITSTNDTILIHCAGAGRVTYFMMAYLVKHEGLSIEDAQRFGEQITYTNYLDLLLGE